MPYKNGIVVKEKESGWVEVVTDKLDACADCVSARNCPSDCKSAKMVTKVRDDIGAHVGDTVSVYISRKSMLKSAALLYLVPVVFLMIGAGTGSALAPLLGLGNTTAALLIGLAGLCFGYFLVKSFSMRLSTESGFFPKIDRILERSVDSETTGSIPIRLNKEGSIAGWQESAASSPPPPQHME
jgi:sigma-E factor negative regulatory protein RseC